MPSLGKSIDLYLMDGTAAGRWQASLSNWNCVLYKIPRGNLKACDDLPELRSPGVYFLFGRDDESGEQFVYVGEGDDVLKRLLQAHNFEKDGSYWTEAVIFVTPDGTLEKGRIKYLESRFYGIVTETKRYIVKNGNKPPQSPVPKKIKDLLEEFILNAQLVMPALGHKVFEPLPSTDTAIAAGTSNELLYFSRSHGKGGQATGKVADDGFWVLKGSYIYPKCASYVPSGIRKKREQYADSIDSNGILQEDISFGSPSYASTFVCGKNSNGLVEWKNKDGVSLKDLNGESSDPDEYLEDIKMGTKIQIPENTELLHLACKKAVAHGYAVPDGFVVIKGSQVCPGERKSCREGIKLQRQDMIKAGKIVDWVFAEDTTFTSPSAAAACIVGGEANGLIMWANENGIRLKDMK